MVKKIFSKKPSAKVKPKKEYYSKYSQDVLNTAKKLYFVLNEDLNSAYSMSKIIDLLKKMYPVDCAKVNKVTLSKWIDQLGWHVQREESIKHAFDEADDMEDLQKTYNVHVYKTHRLKLTEIRNFLNKPHAEDSRKQAVKGLDEDEKLLIEKTGERLGMVLVELRSLNGNAFNSLIKRNKVTNELVLPHVSRSEAWKEYVQSLELIIKLYSAQLVGRLVGNATGGGSPFLPGGGGQQGQQLLKNGFNLQDASEDVLRKTQLVLPDQILTGLMQQLAGGTPFDETASTDIEKIDSSGESHTGGTRPLKPVSRGNEEDS